MSFARLSTLTRLDLVQRVRSVGWYVMLGVFALVLLIVTWLALGANSLSGERGSFAYSVVVIVVLLLALLVAPALSGNAINGEREQATLAPLQVTRATTGEIVVSKLLSAWIAGLMFLAVAAPFLAWAALFGDTEASVVWVSLAVLIVEVAIVAAIGVGLSGIISKPLFSLVVSYLVVAALSVGTLFGFGLAGTAFTSEGVSKYRYAEYDINGLQIPGSCGEWQTDTYPVPRFDRVWWLLAPNPFIVLADATPVQLQQGYPTDAFGGIALAVRSAQIAPQLESSTDDCSPSGSYNDAASQTPSEVFATTTPTWAVGLGLQLVLAGALFAWGWLRTRTPARKLAKGTRVA